MLTVTVCFLLKLLQIFVCTAHFINKTLTKEFMFNQDNSKGIRIEQFNLACMLFGKDLIHTSMLTSLWGIFLHDDAQKYRKKFPGPSRILAQWGKVLFRRAFLSCFSHVTFSILLCANAKWQNVCWVLQNNPTLS